jgi:hypothetical protein
MTRTPALLVALTLAGCTLPQPRQQSIAEATAHCEATRNSPVVHLGIDPTRTIIMPHRWSYAGKSRYGDTHLATLEIRVVDHLEPTFHEYIHRGLRLAGYRFPSNMGGMFRDEEHQLVYHTLDRDFPGLQDNRIPKQRRQWASERWTQGEYVARLDEIESMARSTPGWCDGRKG